MTLIELMIVLVVVSVGILALSGVQTRSSNDVYATGKRTRALELAETHVEMARSLGYAVAVSDSGQTDGFNWWSIVDSVDVSLHRVRVTVTWTERNRPVSIQLVNLMSNR